MCMAAAAVLYHQIALGEPNPKVLGFSIDQAEVKFFHLIATPRTDSLPSDKKWSLECNYIEGCDLDGAKPLDMIKLRLFGHGVAANEETQREWFQRLAQAVDNQEESEVVWWFSNNRSRSPNPSTTTLSLSTSEPGSDNGSSHTHHSEGRSTHTLSRSSQTPQQSSGPLAESEDSKGKGYSTSFGAHQTASQPISESREENTKGRGKKSAKVVFSTFLEGMKLGFRSWRKLRDGTLLAR